MNREGDGTYLGGLVAHMLSTGVSALVNAMGPAILIGG
jgi:hypothetical protein